MEQEAVLERLGEVVGVLEGLVARMEERHIAVTAEASGERIVATAVSAREEELERKLTDAEEKLARLEATSGGRKTAGVRRMFAKESGEVNVAAALDGALGSLSVEQRIAVKAELMRAGVVG